MILIGASLGGVRATQVILAALPPDFAIAIAVVLHRYRQPSDGLRETLQAHSALPVSEVIDKQEIKGGYIYVCPADYHLLIEPQSFSLSTDEPVRFARPCIDVCFESAAQCMRERAIGIVLTGASADGAAGAAAIKYFGGRLLVQDPQDAESPAMPLAAIRSTTPDYVVPLRDMVPTLLRMVG
jgi:two-component system chemotaxis response regulator CheB